MKPDTNAVRALLTVAGIWVAITLNVAINVGINGAFRFYGPSAYCGFGFLLQTCRGID